MSQILLKISASSPMARAGGGDISERELSQEQHNLRTATPPARLQSHPKKQLFFTPVNKFTAKRCGPSPNLERIKSCLDELRSQATTPEHARPKALSLEDLTPSKRMKRDNADGSRCHLSPRRLNTAEEQAAARIGRFMVVCAWRRRRDEIRCLRKTLESQVSCSERLRIQVSTLKSLLDSDNAKVRLAMKELERLKQLLKDKDIEKAVLDREKYALEQDVCSAEDRASEMSIGWRNCRNELDGMRAANAAFERALTAERAAAYEARAQRDQLRMRLAAAEEKIKEHEALLNSAETEAEQLRRENAEKARLLKRSQENLKHEIEERERCTRECSLLSLRVSIAAEETNELRRIVDELRTELTRVAAELKDTKEQLEWWPKPLTRMLGTARSWFRYPMSVPDAVLWTLNSARHGC